MRFSERGNAVVFILVAISLFGALAYTFMRGARSGQGNLSIGQTKILAQEMINDTTLVQRGVNKLLSRGCSENELNFNTPENPNMPNPNAPGDRHCDLFSPEGAGLSINIFKGSALYVGASSQVNSFGSETSAGDLGYFYTDLSDMLCKEINKQLGIPNPDVIPQDTSIISGSFFLGTFYPSGSADPPLNDEDVRMQTRSAGCTYLTTQGRNLFTTVIIDR